MTTKKWIESFLEKRGKSVPSGQPLYRYEVSEAELVFLSALLAGSKNEVDHPVHMIYWSAGYCLFVSEKYRRNYDANWSWQAFNNELGIELSPARRSEIVKLGLGYWRRPVRYRGNGADYLGSLFAEGGLPWSLLANENNGFGRAINAGIGSYHAYKEGGKSLVDVIKGYADFFPMSFQNDEKYQLLALIVESLMGLASQYSLQNLNNPAEYLNQQAPHWRDTFPLPLGEQAGELLVNQWLRDAGDRQAERDRLAEEARNYTVTHVLEDKGDLGSTLSYPLLKASIHLPKKYSVNLDEQSLPTTRVEFVIYEGGSRVKSLGASYGQINNNKFEIEGPARIVELDRRQPELPLRLVVYSGGEQIKTEYIQGSEIDWQSYPAVFQEKVRRIEYVGCASCSSSESELIVLIPSSYRTVLSNPVAQDLKRGGNWYKITEPLELAHDGQVFKIEPSNAGIKQTINFTGAALNLDNPKPLVTWKGWPKCRLIDVEGKDAVPQAYMLNGKRVSSLENLDQYGRFSVVILGQSGEVIARRRFGVLPEDFVLRVAPAINKSPAKLYIKTLSKLEVKVVNDKASYHVIPASDGYEIFLHDDVLNHQYLQLAVIGKNSSVEPVILRIPTPVIGAKVVDENGIEFNSNDLTLDDILGMTIKLFSTESVVFNLCFNLIGLAGNIGRCFSYRSISKPVELSLFSFRDEIVSLLSCSGNQDAYVQLTISAGVHLKHINIYRHSCEPRYTSSLNAYLEFLDFNRNILINTDGIEVLAINLCDPSTGPVDFIQGLHSAFEIPESVMKGGPWLIYPGRSSSKKFRPMVHIPEPEMCSLGEETELKSLNDAARCFHPAELPHAFEPVLDKMSVDFWHSGWDYFKDLKTHCEQVPLSAFESWRSLARHPRALAMAVFRLDMNDLFVERLQNELAVVWEVITVSDWKSAIHSKINCLSERFDLPKQYLKSNAGAQMKRLRTHIFAFATEVFSYEALEPQPPTLVSTAEFKVLHNMLRMRNDGRRWPENHSIELFKWAKHQDALKEIVSLVMPDEVHAVTFMPIFAAYLSAGQAQLSDLGTANSEIRFSFRVLSEFDHYWYDHIYTGILASFN